MSELMKKRGTAFITGLRGHGVLFVLLGLCVILTLVSPRFMRLSNLVNIALQSSVTAIVALGLSFTILAGGIDLSTGSVSALAGAVSAGLAVRAGWAAGPVIFIALLIGLAVGLVNGLLVIWGRIPPFVASLSLMAIGRGLVLVYTQAKPISGLQDAYLFWGSGKLGMVPVPLILLFILALVVILVLEKTRFGHSVYAVGGSEETARLAGISVGQTTLMVYLISGLMAAISGVILTARLWSAQPTAGVGLELEAITAVVLGGTSLMGGAGRPSGPVFGALIMGVIGNGLNLLEIPSYIQQVIKGFILILAVVIDIRSRGPGRNRPVFGD